MSFAARALAGGSDPISISGRRGGLVGRTGGSRASRGCLLAAAVTLALAAPTLGRQGRAQSDAERSGKPPAPTIDKELPRPAPLPRESPARYWQGRCFQPIV
jgi:hypothetical protein